MVREVVRVGYERLLRERLAGHRLVAEINPERMVYTQVQQIVADMARVDHAALDRMSVDYPAILSVFLVAEGIHRWDPDTGFWPNLSIPGLSQQSLGPQFEEALRRLGLETFDEIVERERAHRYVGRILIHGGIPKHSLTGFYRLLLAELRQGEVDAAHLIAAWRVRRTDLFGIHRSVQRFLLHGGEAAEDLLNRCVDMILDFARSESTPEPDEIGLPAYMVEGFQSLSNEEKLAATTNRVVGVPNPRVLLDPLDAFGPFVELGKVSAEHAGAGWRVSGAGNVAASTTRIQMVSLDRAVSWTVGFYEHGEAIRERTYQGLDDEMPVLFFRPESGQLVVNSQVLRLDSVWALYPGGDKVELRDASTQARLRTIAEFPDPSGRWQGYTRRHFDLAGVRAIDVCRDGDPATRIQVRAPSERPRLKGNPMEGVTAAEGRHVYRSAPQLTIPAHAELALERFQLQIRGPGDWVPAPLTSLPRQGERFDLATALPDGGVGLFALSLRGALGLDLREEFMVLPDLEISRPTRLLMPGDGAAVIRVTCPSARIEGGTDGSFEIPQDMDELAVPLALPSGQTANLQVFLPRLMWSLDRTDSPISKYGTGVQRATTQEIEDGLASALSVRTRMPGTRLALLLSAGTQERQATDTFEASGLDGRWTFDLGQFRTTLRTATDPEMQLVLRVNDQQGAPVARVWTRLEVDGIMATSRVVDSFTELRLTFNQNRAVRGRVARLWSLDRPWESALTIPIPDSVEGEAIFTGHDALPAGRYLAEIAVDDPWNPATRPRIGAGNTAAVRVGDHTDADLLARFLDLGEPLAVIEAALTSLTPLRPLTEDEVVSVVGPALEAVDSLIQEQGMRALRGNEFDRVADLITGEPRALLTAVAETRSKQRPSHVVVLGACIAMFERLEDVSRVGIVDTIARSLWVGLPALAALADVPRASSDPDARARCEANLGWQVGIRVPARVGPERVFGAMEEDQLRDLEVAMQLLPKRILEPDAYVLANFQWLFKRFSDEQGLMRWWRHNRDLIHKDHELTPSACARIAERRVQSGGFEWLEIPALVVSAAAHIVERTGEMPRAQETLIEGLPYAASLIEQDLILALIVHSGLEESQSAEPA